MKKFLLLCAIISLSLGDCKLISQKTDRMTDAVISDVECSSNGNKILFELSKVGSENNIKFAQDKSIMLDKVEKPAYSPREMRGYVDIRIDKNPKIQFHAIIYRTEKDIDLLNLDFDQEKILSDQLSNSPTTLLIQYGAVFGDDYKKHIIEFDISSLKNFY